MERDPIASPTQLPSRASSILPNTHTGGRVRVCRARTSDFMASKRRGSNPKGLGAGILRFTLPLLTITGLLAAGATPAVAGTPISCDASSVVAQALPAIVNITVVRVGGPEHETTNAEGEPTKAEGDSAKRSADGHIAVFVGTGSVIDPSGVIVTNKHVIQGAAMIKVTFSDKSTARAQLIAAASLIDLALLKVDVPRPLPTLQFANSDALKLGQPVIAIGNPLGLGTSVSTGVVSALNRDLMRTPFDNFIQTDATINPGNSGGPLLDCAGEMVGVDTALLSNNKTLGSIGLGFALPSNVAKFIASKLDRPDEAMPGWSGLHLQDLTSDLARTFGHPDMAGAIVTRVDPNSPAAQANLQSGDIIMGVDGQALPDNRAILRKIVTSNGDVITLSVWRQDHSMEATLKVRPWPHMMALRSEVLASPEDVALAKTQGCGLHLAMLTDANRRRYHLSDEAGVLVDQVAPGSEAETMGFEAGDVIEKVANMEVKTPEQVKAQVSSRGNGADGDLVPLLVRGSSGTRWRTLYVGRVDVAQLVATPNELNGVGSARNAAARSR